MIMSVVYKAHNVSLSVRHCLDIASHNKWEILGRKMFQKCIKSIRK